MSKKKLNVKFQRHDIKESPKDSIKELVNLYKAAEDESSYVDSEKRFFQEETDPLKKIIEKKRAHKRRAIIATIIISLLVLASTAFAGFLYFSNHRTFKTETLDLSILGPEKVKLGEPTQYQIKYVNTGDVGLEEARMNIQLPHGFIVEKSDPAIINSEVILNTIPTNNTGYITISGHFLDAIDREQKINAILYFVPSNFNSEFSSEASLNTLLELPQIDFSISYPASVTPGQKFNLKIENQNNTNIEFVQTKLELTYPAGFEFLSGTPTPTDTNVWPIEKLAPNAQGKETIVAGNFSKDLTFQTEADRDRSFKIQLLAQGANEQYFLLAEKEITIKISDQPLQSYLIINGTTDNKNVSLGKILTYSLVVKNTGSDDIKDLIAKIAIKSAPVDLVDWEKIVDNNFGQIESGLDGKLIVWTGAEIPKLERLKGKEEVTINFSVPLKSIEQLKDIDVENLNDTHIESIGEIFILRDPDGDTTTSIKSNPVNIYLNSNINLETRALYYYTDGTPLGTGPFPPKVGEKTQLHVFWDITNDLHEMQNIEVSSTLPKYVSIVGTPNVSVGQFNLNEESNTISWKINSLPKSIKAADCTFTIEFTPTDKQKGKFLQLTGNTTLTAKDAMTNDTIIKTKNILTSALEQDEFVTDEGLVK